MNSYRLRSLDALIVGIVAVLTLSTAYIHYWVGGTMLMLNALGYLTLVVVLVATTFLYRRALPLVLIAIAGYAAVTIIGWLIMGPYFDVAYLAKAIEIGLITTIAIWLWRNSAWTRESIRWAIALPGAVLGSHRKPVAKNAAADDE